MMTLIIGGSGSGKSAFAEQYVEKIAGAREKYYIATMKVYDEEGKKKVEKHRTQRRGKGFQTIECSSKIENALDTGMERDGVVLLECMSNLVANEMFTDRGICEKNLVVSRILQGIQVLQDKVGELVIVTNNVSEEGTNYDATTMDYICSLGKINTSLAWKADKVVEVVVGIPVWMKGAKQNVYS